MLHQRHNPCNVIIDGCVRPYRCVSLCWAPGSWGGGWRAGLLMPGMK
ncbi:Hypothetical protein GbCGDNIH9_8486 [Granulibacter bethesdensis]|uniref:Uncharacterized protein n=1 Tax=Granulibacter bethesdensis TaxID=364410 RepID=A0AAC9KBM7_9PROT|nr:Hypothetical protein GbCGDNIH9_8486 [Granulibacter bethesdensis]APH61838.1 Hypothetical protein GbCGDNIH8_8486 [Granulibacter bethesdensis]